MTITELDGRRRPGQSQPLYHANPAATTTAATARAITRHLLDVRCGRPCDANGVPPLVLARASPGRLRPTAAVGLPDDSMTTQEISKHFSNSDRVHGAIAKT